MNLRIKSEYYVNFTDTYFVNIDFPELKEHLEEFFSGDTWVTSLDIINAINDFIWSHTGDEIYDPKYTNNSGIDVDLHELTFENEEEVLKEFSYLIRDDRKKEKTCCDQYTWTSWKYCPDCGKKLIRA